MAICNNTGTIAIYNQSKNLFMSPFADGPIKFVGSLDSNDTRIENITRFGRNFSIVYVPYSMKLLIQELQTMNVQMRIITEDNIEQLENLSYSKNIEKLIGIDKLEPKSIINAIHNKILVTNNNKMIINNNVESIQSENVAASPEIAAVSPELPPILPPNWTRQYNEKYKTYYYFNEVTGESQWEMPTENESPEFVPTSPEFSPPPSSKQNIIASPPLNPPSTSENPLDILTEKAQEYNLNDNVHYNGDSIPTRIWNIKSIGDRTVTIQTDNMQNLEMGENIKVVTANDIYPIGNYSNPLPQPQMVNLQTGGFDDGYHTGYGMNPYMQGGFENPTINFAPSFKIMNGGSDFSTDKSDIVSNDNFKDESHSNQHFQGQIQKGGNVDNENKENKEGSGSGFLDFGKLLIKKIGM